MSKNVKVPDPVYERASDRADELDSTMGEVIRDWMEDSMRLQDAASDAL